jgi:hypothetical protein
MMGQTVPLQDMAHSLSKLANENEVFTRQQIAYAVDEAVRHNRDDAYQLLNDWLSSGQGNMIWTVAYVLFTGRNISRQERYPRLETILTSLPFQFLNALHYSLIDDENKEMAFSVLETFAVEKQVVFINKLANIKENNPSYLDSLFTLLLSSSSPTIKNIPAVVETQIQRWVMARAQAERERIENARKSMSFEQQIGELIGLFFKWLGGLFK